MKSIISARLTYAFVLVVALLVPSGIATAQTPGPAIEYSSLPDSFTVKYRGEGQAGRTGGHPVFNAQHEITGVFFPENVAANELQVQLLKAGSNDALMSDPCTLRKSGASAFSFIPVSGGEAGYTFSEEGDWSNLAYLSFSADKAGSPVQFFAWTRLVVFTTTPEPAQMDVTLLQGDEVTVFSTEVERSVEIPDDQIHLGYQKHSMYGPRLVDASDYLVATVNEPAGLNSKTIINVIDLSGDNEPVIIPIRNSDFDVNDVTSVKVNAEAGLIAVGSKNQGAIYVAAVAADATDREHLIEEYKKGRE